MSGYATALETLNVRAGATAERLVDKSLENHTHLGLAALLIPRARVIHARRDPMDVCFSCFMHPLSPSVLPYTTDLRNCGLFYREYEGIMRYWAETLGVGPWFHMPHLRPDDFAYRGKSSDPEISLAIAYSGRLQLELIQQHNDAQSMYKDSIDAGLCKRPANRLPIN